MYCNHRSSFQSQPKIRHHGRRHCRKSEERVTENHQRALQEDRQGEEQGAEGARPKRTARHHGEPHKVSGDSPEDPRVWRGQLPKGDRHRGENQEDRGRSRSPSSEVSAWQVCNFVKQVKQQDLQEEGAGRPGQVCAPVCGGDPKPQAGGRGEGGGPLFLPPHQHRLGLPDGGPEARLRLLQGCDGHQDGPGEGCHRYLRQLCPHPQKGLATLRDKDAEEVAKCQAVQVLHRLRWQHLRGGRGGGEEGEGDLHLGAGGGGEEGGAGCWGRHQEEGGRGEGGQGGVLLHYDSRGGEGEVRCPGLELIHDYPSLALLNPFYGLAAALSRGVEYPSGRTLL